MRQGGVYLVHSWAQSRNRADLHQLGKPEGVLNESLVELGVTRAIHTAHTPHGEHLVGMDREGRWIGFFVDEFDPGIEPLVN